MSTPSFFHVQKPVPDAYDIGYKIGLVPWGEKGKSSNSSIIKRLEKELTALQREKANQPLDEAKRAKLKYLHDTLNCFNAERETSIAGRGKISSFFRSLGTKITSKKIDRLYTKVYELEDVVLSHHSKVKPIIKPKEKQPAKNPNHQIDALLESLGSDDLSDDAIEKQLMELLNEENVKYIANHLPAQRLHNLANAVYILLVLTNNNQTLYYFTQNNPDVEIHKYFLNSNVSLDPILPAIIEGWSKVKNPVINIAVVDAQIPVRDLKHWDRLIYEIDGIKHLADEAPITITAAAIMEKGARILATQAQYDEVDPFKIIDQLSEKWRVELN